MTNAQQVTLCSIKRILAYGRAEDVPVPMLVSDGPLSPNGSLLVQLVAQNGTILEASFLIEPGGCVAELAVPVRRDGALG